MQAQRSEPLPVVMKFGGSSVADHQALRRVADKVAERTRERPVVVVVSAMGKSTDDLVEEAHALCSEPPARELDMLLTTGERRSMALLALALHDQGIRAISLTGSQVGIITDHRHGQARVVEVRPFRILDELAAGYDVVIVGGFQGVSYKREVTTLGRGGSDTTAVALAAALGTDCEIYSDVDGVYNADPRVVPEATRMDAIDYDAMQALARAGAKVLHGQAVALAQKAGISIHARAARDEREPGRTPAQTLIHHQRDASPGVMAVAHDDVCLLEVSFVTAPTDAGRLAAEILAEGLMFPRTGPRGISGLVSAGQRDDTGTVLGRIGEILERADAAVHDVLVDERHALVSAVGTGLERRDDLVHHAATALETAAIAVHGSFADGHTLGFLVPRADAPVATRALHRALMVDATPAAATPDPA